MTTHRREYFSKKSQKKRSVLANTLAWIVLIILVALFCVLLPMCENARANPPTTWKFYIMGVDVSELRDLQPKDCGAVLVGAAASMAAHVAGHYIAAELFDVEITQVGLRENLDRPNQWVYRGGFLFQLAVNTILVELDNSYFTKGFTTFTAVELATYPVRRPTSGDFHSLDNGDLEYFLYSTWAAHNLWRMNNDN